MSTETENHTLRLLQEMRAEMRDRFNQLDEKTDNVAISMKELATTQAAVLQIMATQENRLLRIEGDIVHIKKRLQLAEA